MLKYGCTRLEIGVQSVYEDVARDTNRQVVFSKLSPLMCYTTLSLRVVFLDAQKIHKKTHIKRLQHEFSLVLITVQVVFLDMEWQTIYVCDYLP